MSAEPRDAGRTGLPYRLLAEHAGSGRIGVLAFWGRRVRRLLPALLLMLVVVAAVSHWLVRPEELPALRWDGGLDQRNSW